MSKIFNDKIKSKAHYMIRHFESFVLIYVTMSQGLRLFYYPAMMNSFDYAEAVERIMDRTSFHPYALAAIFCSVALTKLVGLLTKNIKIRQVGIVAMFVLWTTYGVSFLLSQPPNSMTLFSSGYALIALILALRERG